jgi:hypothetical protein
MNGIPPALVAGVLVEALIIGMYGLARLIFWACGGE